jgi:outer membrane protein TolC
MMFKLTLGFILFLITLPGYSQSISGLLESAGRENQINLSAIVDYELATLRFEKGRIEARTRLDSLNAENAYAQAQGDYRRALQSYYHDVVDALFNVATADLDLEIAVLRRDTALEQQRAAESRYRNGLVSESELLEFRLTYQTTVIEHQRLVWQTQESRQLFQNTTGIPWAVGFITEPQARSSLPGDLEQWQKGDSSLQRAAIALEVAQIRLSQLPGNASVFDRRIIEAEVQKAELTYQQARVNSERNYLGLLRRIQNQQAVLSIRHDELQLYRDLEQEAQVRYQRGQISLTQRDQERIRRITALKSLREAQRSYIKSLLEFAVAFELEPREVL